MISPRLAIAATILTIAVAVPSVVAADAASAAAPAKSYANCTAVHKVYTGGIARAGVKTNTVVSKGKVTHRALKGRVMTSTALYNANRKLDRDGDGVACELD